MNETKTILAIEDETSLLRALDIELLDAGFKVHVAEDGKTGLKKINNLIPDLILLDLMLPEMSGYEVLEAVKKNPKTKHIPVIILSNVDKGEEIKKLKQLGAHDFFVKHETDLGVLVKKIKSITLS